MDLETSNNQVFTPSFQRHPNFRPSKLVPVEILAEIFLHSLPPTNLSQARQKTTLALVCRLWNDIIEATPILWSRISFKDAPSYVMRSLRKSAKSPIDVYGVCSNAERNYWWSHYSCCLQLVREVRQHSDRWRRVVLLVAHDARPVELAPTHSPYLEFVELFGETRGIINDDYYPLVTIPRAPIPRAPSLRALILDGIKFARWDISFPPTLSCLVIQKLRTSPREILAVLTASPNLTVLHLSQLDSLEMNNGPPDSGAVDLASLRKLTFNEVESNIIRDVMPRLKVPSECKVSLKSRLYGRDGRASFLDPALSQYHETFQRVGEIIPVRISLQSFEIEVILQSFVGISSSGCPTRPQF